MYRAPYRNFGDQESLLATHTVARVVKGTNTIRAKGAAIRWYEIRNISSSPILFQQGTHGPDQKWRWMPSIGMDGAGNIAVGYSTSGGRIHPGIRFTGRTPDDPPGTMRRETMIKRGTGSQRGYDGRWGDYSAMSIDPTDDCTFWYTNEYLPRTNRCERDPETDSCLLQEDGEKIFEVAWATWIASFRFPNCE